MGLMIYSLEILSPEAKRDYFIYILDYGWSEPLADVIRKNFQTLARWASKNDSAIITGVGELGHFDNEVLSWHSINGEDAENILPAILITRTNPHKFREFSDLGNKKVDKDLSYILIPLKKFCKSETDVLNLLNKIITDIEKKKDLDDFQVKKEIKPGLGRAIVKSIILEPNFAGLGFSFNKLKDFLK
jgi:hypothetical protein